MGATTFENLDLACAKAGKSIAEKPSNELHKVVTDALSVLEEQGPYALFLFLRTHSKEKMAKNVSQKLHDFLKENPRQHHLLPGYRDLFPALQELTKDLDNLLLAHGLIRQALVYTRYHARPKDESKEESEVASPLFIGIPPAGSLDRCRLYLSARTLHGALAAEIARSRCEESFPDYGKIGWELALNCRFTYLYPAEKSGENFLAWIPKYEVGEGCRWHREGDGEFPPDRDRDFKRRLLTSRASTAITPETDSASEGTLREMECMNPWWRDASNHQAEPKPVFLLGYVFLRNNGFRRQLSSIDNLFVGGDIRYGLGEISLVQWDDLTDDSLIFDKSVNLSNENPEVCSDFVWGHVPTNDHVADDKMRGAKEFLGGWEITAPWKGCLTWAPGSYLKDQGCWAVDTYGNWIYQGACKR